MFAVSSAENGDIGAPNARECKMYEQMNQQQDKEQRVQLIQTQCRLVPGRLHSKNLQKQKADRHMFYTVI
jgi:hypothetical protein